MKKYLTFLSFIICSFAFAQNFVGSWTGQLAVMGQKLDLVFHIEQLENNYSAKLDVPAQGAKGLNANNTWVEKDSIIIDFKQLNANYKGAIKKDSIDGVFEQYGQRFALVLKKGEIKLERPQTPQPPFDYHIEEVSFDNVDAGITLSGTLTWPKNGKDFPTVILINGSGPLNRNSEMFGHQYFWVLADWLTKQGIAVLRFDERGVGQSTGNYYEANTFDLAEDVKAAYRFLYKNKKINKKKIGLIGHSEGGIIAAILASQIKLIDFTVLMAAPSLRGKELMLLQKKKIEQQQGVPEMAIDQSQRIFEGAYDLILKSDDEEDLKTELENYFNEAFKGALPETQKNQLIAQLTSTWMRTFIKLDPKKYLEQVSCPLLVLNGTKDLQVPIDENIKLMKEVFGKSGHEHVEFHAIESANHLFQQSETGLPTEYAKLEQTIDPSVLELISTWINKNE